MPELSVLIPFLTALFFLEITPGPDMMLVIARGIGQGRRVALLSMLGMVFFSGIFQVGLLVLGLGALLQAHPVSLLFLQWIGAAYLIYLGVRMIRSHGSNTQQTSVIKQASAWQIIREGTINNLTNPKSILFMFAFLPQFVNPTMGPVWMQLLILGSIQKLTGILSLGSVAIASGTVGQWLSRCPKCLVWQGRFTGLVMIALGLRLLATGDFHALEAK